MELCDQPSRTLRSQRRKPSPTLSQLIDSYFFHVRESLTPTTVAAYGHSLNALVAVLGDVPAADIKGTDMTAFLRARREQGRSEATINGDYTRVQTFFRWCVTAKHLKSSPCALVRAPRRPNKAGRTVTREQFDRMLVWCDESVMPYRDASLLWLLWDTGARINELCGMEYQDLDLLTRTAFLRWENVKTKADRTVAFTEEAAAVLNDYIVFERGTEPGPFLISSKTGARFHPTTGSALVRKLARTAGVEASAHDFRRAFVSRMQAAGMSDSLIMQLSGHHSVLMVRRYAAANATENALKAYRKGVG